MNVNWRVPLNGRGPSSTVKTREDGLQANTWIGTAARKMVAPIRLQHSSHVHVPEDVGCTPEM